MAALGWLLNLGFAGGGAYVPPVVTETQTYGGWAQPSYIKRKPFKRTDDLREQIRDIFRELEEVTAPAKDVANVEAKAENISERVIIAQTLGNSAAREREIESAISDLRKLQDSVERMVRDKKRRAMMEEEEHLILTLGL